MVALLLIYKPPRCFLPNFESTGLSVQEKKPKLDLQDDRECKCHGHGHHDLKNRIQMLPTKFRVNWPFVSGEEAQNIFSNGDHAMMEAIFDF